MDTRMAPLVLSALVLFAAACNPTRRPADFDAAAHAVERGDVPLMAPAEVPAGTVVYEDDFSGPTLDPAIWNATSGVYALRDGVLTVREARNHPLWLRLPLPCDVEVEFTAWSGSPDGDLKFELFGDGVSYAREASYTATGYVFIFGGWRNSVSTIVRRDEHRARLVVDERTRVEANRRYRFTVRVTGGRIAWLIDGEPFLAAEDPDPICRTGFVHFAVNDWSVPVFFDDLRITAR